MAAIQASKMSGFGLKAQENQAGIFIAAYRPRWIPEGACFGGHTAAPHHLSGPPPPATAVLEIGATVAVPIVSAAAASAIASNVFMSALLSDRR
jgi:hypothetical protein